MTATASKNPSSPSSVVAGESPHVAHKTMIAERLTNAVKAAPSTNRSSDLVPLTHDYEMMRKTFKVLIATTKNYRDAMVNMDKARMDVAAKFSSLSSKTPIVETVGTMASVIHDISHEADAFHNSFQDKVIDYCTEWEAVVTSRVDTDIKAANKLHEDLGHYERKVEKLRHAVKVLTDKDKAPSKSQQERLDRNEEKLEQAWQTYERSASTLCNLLEEVTKRGWKDLYPLVKACNHLEAERALAEHNITTRLYGVNDELDEIAQTAPSHDEKPAVPIALSNESDGTTGSSHPSDDDKSEEEKAEEVDTD